jgi:arsenical pump membrane protein
MSALGDLVVILVLTGVVVALAARPGNVPEWVSATVAAAAILLAGAVHPGDVPAIVRNVADVLVFLSSMLVVSHLAAEAGVFAAASLKVVAWSRGSGIRLFILLYILGAALTTFFSLDVSVVVMTPLVLAIVHRAGLPAVPYLMLCPFAANVPSLLLPISNLTNLIVVEGLHIHLVTYTATMAIPALVAAGVSLWALIAIFRRQLPQAVHHVSLDVRPMSRAGRLNAFGLALVLAGLFVAGVADWPLWWITVPAALVFILIGAAAGTMRATPTLVAASPGLLVFVVAMGIVVKAASDLLMRHVSISADTSPTVAAVFGAGAAAVLSNIVNNVPVALATVALASTLPAPLDHALGYGALVGANIGPALTTFGSLATLIWLTTIRSAGHDLRPRDYLRISGRIVPPTLAATTIALAVVLLVAP